MLVWKGGVRVIVVLAINIVVEIVELLKEGNVFTVVQVLSNSTLMRI